MESKQTDPFLSPKLRRLSGRIKELIDEGKEISKLEKPSEYVGPYIKEHVRLQAWISEVNNIVEKAFGHQSTQVHHLSQLIPHGPALVSHSSEVLSIVGLLVGCLNDLEGGYLLGQEFLIAAELFDTLIEQAEHLNRNGYKDPAAVLGRVVLEESLRRIAKREGLDSTQKPSTLNDSLKTAGIFAQPQWRMVQAWIDTGNAAAHGKFSDYNQDDVTRMLNGISSFLAIDFKA